MLATSTVTPDPVSTVGVYGCIRGDDAQHGQTRDAMLASCMLVRYMDVINMCESQVRAAAHVAADIEDSANRSFCATHPMAVLVQLRAQECYQRVSAITGHGNEAAET